MQTDLTDFGEFYKTKHQGRKLEWDHALGTATLKARFNAGQKELSVSLYQAVVLILFNETVELPFTDILAQTNMGALQRFFFPVCVLHYLRLNVRPC
jgi:cullin-4